ncbi:MAG: patatin-like phospholipase family protein [Paramuribaculum sp.]|nr:patatin-like phospholipase family protein [Paramuribaculum sp.]
MRRFLTGALMLAALAGTATEKGDTVTGTRPQAVGLVLSGGGAKGIAHIGVIKALEENNIPIDYITGTSMGAIIGGLYSCGYTPDEMLELIKSKGFEYWSSGKIDPSLTYYYATSERTPALVHFNLGSNGTKNSPGLLPTSLINPLPMNFAFMELFSAYTAQCGGNFNNLFVPLRTVTSNVYAKHKIVLKSGSLGDAVRASMSFPLVFRPIEIDSVLVYDGGIYDNYPFNVMHTDFAPDIMIGSNVSGPDAKPKANDIMQQLEDMIIQNNDYNLPPEWGVSLTVPVRMFGLLDWDEADTICAIGYNTAMQMMDSIKTRVTARIDPQIRTLRREVFKSQTPYVRFDSVTVTGATKNQNEYIRYLFTHNSPDTFGLNRAKDSYYRAITPGKLENLVPEAVYNDSTRLFDLRLKATVKDNFRIGFGGYISSSTSSMLFFSGGYNTMSFNSLDANINAWIGQSYLAALANARINLLTGVPSSLKLQIAATRQKLCESEKLFFKDNGPISLLHTEYFSRLIYTLAAGRRGKFDIGAGYGYLIDSFFPNNHSDFQRSDRDKTSRSLGEIIARYSHTTLDNESYPTAGAAYSVTAIGTHGRYHYTPSVSSNVAPVRENMTFGQIEASATNFFSLGRHAAFGTEFNALVSTRKLLNTYNSSIALAPAFNPTPASYNSFNPALRANSYVTAGIIPIWKINSTVQLRGTFHTFLPFKKIMEGENNTVHYGKLFANPQFFGETAFAVTLPFATLSAYANYISYPARNWNFGISLGLFVLAPKFLR